jgi:transcriptional regulator with XRE-family HTH domain
VTTKQRPGDRGLHRGRHLLQELIAECRAARVAANLSQADVGRAIGLSDSEVSRIERDQVPNVALVVVAQYLSVVGLELSARAFPVGGGVRDRGQLPLLGRFRHRIGDALAWRTEVPLAIPGDLRAWDAGLFGKGLRIGLDAETRLRDVQAVDRRIMLKLRDSGWNRAILFVSETRWNRTLLREFDTILRANYPVPQLHALRALRSGSDPGGNCLIVL